MDQDTLKKKEIWKEVAINWDLEEIAVSNSVSYIIRNKTTKGYLTLEIEQLTSGHTLQQTVSFMSHFASTRAVKVSWAGDGSALQTEVTDGE